MTQQNQKEEAAKVLTTIEDTDAYLSAYRKIPYSLIRQELDVDATDVTEELNQICKYYGVYKKGKSFTVEGTNGDYTPAMLRYKMSATLVNKEARFLFAEQPDIKVEPKGDVGEATDDSKKALIILNDLVETVLRKNNFEEILLKAAKDCFIGKRVACLLNFNEEDGITISFLTSLQFIYETKPGNPRELSKFVSFTVIKETKNQSAKRIFKKKYEAEWVDGKKTVYLEEAIYNGVGEKVEDVTERCEVKLNFIPAVIIINDGLTSEQTGESDIETLQDFEYWYSKLGNADSDAERKSMNPTKYLVDMNNNSTKNLSTSAGALWDLGSDQNLEAPNPQVGLLEPRMSYSDALKISLDRIKTAGYEQVDMPNITNETLSGMITSGKALKAIYWPLITRCKEKMKTWGPAIENLIDMLIKGAYTYPNTIKNYVNEALMAVNYEIGVTQNTPLPEDELEEKTSDLAEIETKTMSRKSYMKKWRGLTDNEVNDELRQIALESQILEDSFAGSSSGFNGDNTPLSGNNGAEEFSLAGGNVLKRDGTQGKNSGRGDKASQDGQSGEQVQQTQVQEISQSMSKLNGTQISALISVLTNFKNGVFSQAQAEAIIKTMGFDAEFAKSLLEEEQEKIIGGLANV